MLKLKLEKVKLLSYEYALKCFDVEKKDLDEWLRRELLREKQNSSNNKQLKSRKERSYK